MVQRLCEQQPTASTFGILIKDNWEKLRDSLAVETKVPGRRTIGILADANDSLENRWRSIAGKLRQERIETPPSPCPDGTIIDGDPRVGIWLMPDNMTPGELEDFVVQMIPEGDTVWPRSRRYIDDIPSAERKFSEGKTRRAQLHSWMATREEPRQMGLAILAGDLVVHGPLCRRFLGWLKRLFA